MINILLSNNSLKTAKTKYCFRSSIDQTLNTDDLVNEIVKYHSSFTEADARAMFTVLGEKVKEYANKGYKVELPFGYVYVSANGTANSTNEGFTPGESDHRFTARFSFKSDAVSEMTTNPEYRLVGTSYVIKPEIQSIVSFLDTGKENTELEVTAGAIVRVKGKYLSFDSTDDKQGIFFVSDSGEVRFTKYHSIGTNIVDAYVPSDIASGSYKIKIVTKPGVDRYEESTFSEVITV